MHKHNFLWLRLLRLLWHQRQDILKTQAGASKQYRAWLEALPIRRKPLLKVGCDMGQRQLARFAGRHTAPGLEAAAPASVSVSTTMRLKALLHATHRMYIPIQRKAIDALLTDCENQLVFDQSPYAWREWMMSQFLEHGSQAVLAMVRDNVQLLNHCSQRCEGEGPRSAAHGAVSRASPRGEDFICYRMTTC